MYFRFCSFSVHRTLISVALSSIYGGALAQTPTPDALDLEFTNAAYPVVITPTRLKQPLADVPASMTVITGEMLRRYGISNIPDALRLVPGMHVSRISGSDYAINYHGTRKVFPRRLNVLIDGMAAYLPALSQMEWTQLPVALDDIDRIEVIRGPGSASYGPNSMMAVINILTKHPKDVESTMVEVAGDNHQTLDLTARLATTLGGTSVRLTASAHRDTGYDVLARLPARDTTKANHLSIRMDRELADGSALRLTGSVISSTIQRLTTGVEALISQMPAPEFQIGSELLALRWTKPLTSDHELQINAFHGRFELNQTSRLCGPPLALWPETAHLFNVSPRITSILADGIVAGRLSLDDIPSDLTPAEIDAITKLSNRIQATPGFGIWPYVCGTVRPGGSEERTQVELQNTFVVSPQLRLVGGIGWKGQNADSQTYLHGRVSNTVSWLFGHVEYRPKPWLTFNAGGYREHNSLSGSTFAPRMAVNVRLAEGHTVRGVVSKGLRTPDIFEEKADWGLTVYDLSRPVNGNETSADVFLRTKAQGGLRSEKIWSRELGYLLQDRRWGLSFDTRLFDEKLTHLISNTLNIESFRADNNGTVRLTGAEFQLQWEIASDWSGWMQYSRLLNRQGNTMAERSQYARHSSAIGLSWLISDRWRSAIGHYNATGDGAYELGYARTDLTMSRDQPFAWRNAQASLTLSYLHTRAARNFRDVNRHITAAYDRPLSVLARVRMAF